MSLSQHASAQYGVLYNVHLQFKLVTVSCRLYLRQKDGIFILNVVYQIWLCQNLEFTKKYYTMH